MTNKIFKALALMALPFALGLPVQVVASKVVIEEVIVTGTRVADRSAADSTVPVDVITGSDFRDNASTDIQDLLRTAVPSYDVNTQPISDAATITRPANVRGLSPDNVLVLVNGKRRHRGSIISFLGGGISDGAQGVDMASIPSLALRQVEVLRDGASSQYGSDAIAGVLNLLLRDDAQGFELVTRYGSTYEGDGDTYSVAANLGLPIGDTGFVNMTAEIREADGTVRAGPRSDVAYAIANGYTPVADFKGINSYTNKVPQYWGQPDVEDDVKFFFNSAIEINESAELYAFGNYAERSVTGGFFYRNVVGSANNLTGGSTGQRGGVYRGPTVDPATGLELAEGATGGVPSILVGDLDGGTSCIDGIPLGGAGGVTPDPDLQSQVTASANCFSFIETIPAGFVPRFGGDNEDQALTLGVRGELNVGNGLTYDVSAQQGSNRTDFYIRNTINASLGPDTPRDFVPGGQEQTETLYNANFVYTLDVGLASDLNVAFGAEYREEDFDLYAGDAASFALGPLTAQGFSSSSNGFGGFPESTSASQDSTAFYIDLEADVTETVTVQAAVRNEDYSNFGDATDYKLAGLARLSDWLRFRAAISTGFHAPTAGQANITNVTTQIVDGALIDQGTLPLVSPAGQLAADYIESQGNGRPTLGPEEAKNFSFGFGMEFENSKWTVDYYEIEVTDRIALGANVDFLAALNFAGGGTDHRTVSAALTALGNAGTINRGSFVGLEDLQEFRFFTNSFDTTTRGVDIVGSTDFPLWNGESKITLALNYNKTKVDDRGTINPISQSRVEALEDLLPNVKGNISWSHVQGAFRTLVRLNHYGPWRSTVNEYNLGSRSLVDVQVSYDFNENLEMVVGVDNLFDNYPTENPGAGAVGQRYPRDSPYGFNGGSWYLQVRYGL